MRMLNSFCLLALLWPALALAEPHEACIPLQDGRISLRQVGDSLSHILHVPQSVLDQLTLPDVAIDMRGIGGWIAVRAVNGALGDGFQVRVGDEALVIWFDPDKLPSDWDSGCDAAARFVEIAAPDATARQNRRFGLLMPAALDARLPLVVLIHGLDGDANSCADLGSLLQQDGHQVAYFSYPADQPLDRSALLLSGCMADLHRNMPGMRIDVVTQSMGGLIARQYIEGPGYVGGIDRLIMIAPPNDGSVWSRLSMLMKLAVNAADCCNDSQWSPAWLITQGVTQAGRDLQPGSKFLVELNSRARRQGVKYTIIAGNLPVGYRLGAQTLALGDRLLGDVVPDSWISRQIGSAFDCQIQRLAEHTGQNDGPVSLQSARLAGVNDFVVVPADHVALYKCVGGRPPASWQAIQHRLDEHPHGG
jgi:hypothetical protein